MLFSVGSTISFVGSIILIIWLVGLGLFCLIYKLVKNHKLKKQASKQAKRKSGGSSEN